MDLLKQEQTIGSGSFFKGGDLETRRGRKSNLVGPPWRTSMLQAC